MLEQQIHGLWGGKQVAKGTPLAAPPKRFKVLGGNVSAPRADGSSPYSDLSKHGNETDWVDSLSGNGDPVVSGTPEEVAWSLWGFTGGETTAAVAGPPAKTKHTTKPLPGMGHWLTFFARKGVTQIMRQQFADSMISSIVLDGSTANKEVRLTKTFVSLDPAINKAADPAAALPVKAPFLYTDGTGTFTIDGVVFKGHSQFTLTLNDDLQPVQGDDERPYDFQLGNPTIGLGVTVFMDADGLAQYNKLVYGTAVPAADQKPLDRLPALGSYGFYLKARDSAGAVNGDELKLTMANIKWAVPDAPAFNPGGGGTTEVALAGAPRSVAGSDLWGIDVSCDATAFTI